MRLAILVCLSSRTFASVVAPALQRPALLRRPRVAAAGVRCAEGDDDKSIVERLGLPTNIISEKSNPYVTSKADRMREKFGEKSVVGQSARSGGRAGVEDRLSEDIARFKAERGPDPSALTADEEPSMLMKTIDTLGTILTFNFVIICIFFTWFLVGVGAQFGADDVAIINAFRGAWDFLILPLLTTHMTLTFLSFGLEKLVNAGTA